MPSLLVVGLCLAALISAGAVQAGALTPRAAAASTVLGTLVFAAGGISWSMPLLTFFATSALLSAGNADPSIPRAGSQEPGSPRRTARQVLANGSMPALWASCHMLFPAGVWAVLFSAAVATAGADTWATEIGRRSGAAPRDVLTGRRVPAGTSGGITLPGTTASLAGSSLIALTSLLTRTISLHDSLAVVLAGFGGAVVDSLLGASLQEQRWCLLCSVETEDARHPACLTPTVHRRGIPGFDNDWVNLTACLAGSGLGLLSAAVM